MYLRSRRPAPRRGTAAVEMAVVVTFLITVAVGMMEVTRAIQVKHYLTDAARSSCRLAIQPGSTNSSVTANVNSILTANGIDPTKATTTVTVNGKQVDVSTAAQYDPVAVKIQVPISAVTWVTPMFFTNTSVESETLVMMRQR